MGIAILKGHECHKHPNYLNWTMMKYDNFDVGDLRTWIRVNCKGHVTIGAAYLYFESEQDALLFKLAK